MYSGLHITLSYATPFLTWLPHTDLLLDIDATITSPRATVVSIAASEYLHHDVPHAPCSSLPHVLTVSSSSRVQRCIITRNNFQLTFPTFNKIQKLCALLITTNHSASSGPRANHRIYQSLWRHSTWTGLRAYFPG